MLPTESGKVRPASCRDKGRSGGDEGALCLSSWPDEWSGLREATRSHPHQDKHKAPTLLHIHPLSLQDTGRRQTFPIIPRFGWQKSSGGQSMLLICIIYPISNTGGNRYAQAYHPSFSAYSGSRGGRGHRCSTTPTEQRCNGYRHAG